MFNNLGTPCTSYVCKSPKISSFLLGKGCGTTTAIRYLDYVPERESDRACVFVTNKRAYEEFKSGKKSEFKSFIKQEKRCFTMCLRL